MAQSLPGHAEILKTLKSAFGYDGFRPLQEGIVGSILRGQDVFVLMQTGGGKSLCYQLPALLRDGLTVVVSPLIALMKDQVDRLQAMGVAASFINSSLTPSEAGRREAAVARGATRLLYVAPERLMAPGFLRLLLSVRPAAFAIDEAHCISEWGHDFRPDYRELRQLRQLFPSASLAAFTATATRRVQTDIVAQLELRQAAIFRGSFNRPNLVYDVRPKEAAYQQLAAYVRARGEVSGIVYCQSRAGTEHLAARLQADGFSAAPYHAGLEGEERRLRQEAFVKDDLRIIVATIAFGMGIDKPDVRFVAHYDLPKNLEGYYQESGRAGRDGEPSDCILFYSRADAAKHEYFIRQKPSAAERRIASEQLRVMIAWAESATCRRHALLGYFDEQLEVSPEPCCDVCSEPVGMADYTIPAQMFLSCAKRAGEGFGITHLIRVLRGSRDGRILRAGHDRLSTYGIGADRSRGEWRHLADGLLRAGYIRLTASEFNVVRVTELGNAVLFRAEKVMLPEARRADPEPSGAGPEPEKALFEQLRALRKRLADERRIPPYAVFHDATLRQMASELPASREQFRRLQGVGERKLADFGDGFLSVIAQFVRETGARPTARKPEPSAPRHATVTDSVQATLGLFREGYDPVAIAAARRLAASTVAEHLVVALEAGEEMGLDRLVARAKRRAIEAAFAELGPSPLKPVMERLGEGYSYDELRFVRAAQQARGQK